MGNRPDVTTVLSARALVDPKFVRKVIVATELERHRAVVGGVGVDAPRLLGVVGQARRLHALIFGIGLGVTIVGLMLLGIGGLLLGIVALTGGGLYVKGRVMPRLLVRPEKANSERSPVRNGALVVYSGFRPFVGAGITRTQWTLTVDASNPADDSEPISPFSVEQVREALMAGLARLRLPELVHGIDLRDRTTSVARRFYINGEDVEGPLLPSDPVNEPPEVDIAGEAATDIESGKLAARDYIAVEVPRWDDDLVTSTFLRVSEALVPGDESDPLERTLFIEGSEWVLPSISSDDRAPERFMNGMTGKDLAMEVIEGFKGLLRMLVHLSWEVTLPVRRVLIRRRVRSSLARGLPVDRGAEKSIREMATGDVYRRYFQLTDHDRDVKLIQGRVFSTLREFLGSHGVDVSSLQEQTKTIENNQIIVNGSGNTVSGNEVGSRRNTPFERATRVAERLSGTRSS